jgi:hypothetical protein
MLHPNLSRRKFLITMISLDLAEIITRWQKKTNQAKKLLKEEDLVVVQQARQKRNLNNRMKMKKNLPNEEKLVNNSCLKIGQFCLMSYSSKI